MSYAASLWPAMALAIDMNRVGHSSGVVYPAFDLVRDNILVAKNADRITVAPSEKGTYDIALRSY